jgi:Cu+-exporting ATPase
MTHTYNITGMTCDGCRTKVEKTLNAIDGVEAKVSLNPPIATITMEKHIPTAQFQEALTAVGKYTIEMTNSKMSEQSATNEVLSLIHI